MQILCSVLASAPLLQSFSVRLAKASARSSAWKHFSFRSRGVSWKRAFEENMRMILMQKDKAARLASPFTLSTTPPPSPGALARQAFSRFSWPYLVHIHLDALEDIGPLLQMAPNLTHLSLRMLEGFDSLSCNQFLNDFRAATLPKLKALSFSARSLHLTDREESAVRGVELLEEIGQACPKLEYLDLKVNAYATSILPFVTVYNRSSYSVSSSTELINHYTESFFSARFSSPLWPTSRTSALYTSPAACSIKKKWISSLLSALMLTNGADQIADSR